MRNVQVHGKDVERARAGQRVALNLPGVSRDEIERGDMVGTPGYLHPTMMLDARLHLIAHAPRPLKNRARVRLHHGTREVMARAVLLGGREELRPGESAFVQFRLESPVTAVYGDRYIVRSYSPVTTIGGGTVLDSHPRKHRHHQQEILHSLARREAGDPRDLALLVLEEKGLPLSFSELLSWTEIKEEALRTALDELMGSGKLLAVEADDPLYATPALLTGLQERLSSLTAEMHAANPLKAGIEKEALRQRLDPGMGLEVFEALLRSAVSAGMLEVDKGRVRLKGGGRQLSQEDSRAREEVLQAIRAGGFSPPLFKELMEKHALEKSRLRDLLGMLLEEGEIEQVNPEYFLAAGRLAEAEELIRRHLAEHGRLGVADLREMLGASRKYAIPLLEYFDRNRVTRREGDYRLPF